MANFWDGGPDEEDLLHPQAVNPQGSDAYREPASSEPDLRALMSDPKATPEQLGFTDPTAVQAAPTAIGPGASSVVSPETATNLARSMGISQGDKGFNEQEKNSLQDQAKHSRTQIFSKTPYESRLELENAQGEIPAIAKDELGNTIYEKDENGLPTNRPVYDLDRTTEDPNNPVVQQKKNLADLQKQTAMRLQYAPNNVDLSPLMAFADAVGGKNSHLAASYRPQLYSDAANAAQAQMDQIAKSKNDISKEVLQNMKNQNGGSLLDLAALNAMSANEAGLQAPKGNPQQIAMGLSRQANQQMKPLQDASLATQEAQRLLSSTSSFSDTVAREKIARALIGGRISNYDQTIIQGNSSAMGRLDNVIARLSDGEFSPPSRAEIQDALNTVNTANAQEGALRLKRINAMGKGFGVDDAVLSPMTDPSLWGLGNVSAGTMSAVHAKTQKALAPKSGGPSGSMSFDQWKASQGQ